MAKILQEIKKKLTPNVVHQVHRHETVLTIVWVSSVLMAFGLALGLFCVYNRILILEQAVRVLAA
jgi:hypothetical protein